MTRPDPDALARAVAAAFRFDPSVRDDAEHLSAVLHDMEPSVRPVQLRAVVAAVTGDLGRMVTQRITESDAAIAQRFAAEHPDFDPTLGAEVVSVFRQSAGARPAAPPAGDRFAAETVLPSAAETVAPAAAETESPSVAETVAPAAAETVTSPARTAPPVAAGAETQLRPEAAGSQHPTRPPPAPSGRSRRLAWVAAAVVVVVAAVVLVLVLRGGGDDKPVAGSTGTTGTSGAPTTNSSDTSSPSTSTSASSTPGGAGAPPAPFTSAVLWQRFGKPFFTAAQCYVPKDTPDHHFPFALPDKELVNCSSPSGNANLWCKNTTTEIKAERTHYLSVAVPGTMRTESGKPAGWPRAADGVQVSFLHDKLKGLPARVYFDSPSLLCGAELQAADGESRAQLEKFFHDGRSG